MKDFKINKNKKYDNKKDCYEIVITFMEGDADGQEKINFVFEKSKLEDPKFKKYVSDFIDSIDACVNLDNRGRVGFCDVEEAAKWYGYGKDRCKHNYGGDVNWGRFCECRTELDEDFEEDFDDLVPYQEEDNFFSYSIPTYFDGFYTSYDKIDMYYYDSEGIKFDVDIE